MRERFLYKNKEPVYGFCNFNNLVPLTGVEPVRYCYRGILSPLRLPIPPQRQIVGGTIQIRTGDEGVADLCLTTWLWCHNTLPKQSWSGRRDSDPRHLPWQGNALPLSHSRKSLFTSTAKLGLTYLRIYITKLFPIMQVFLLYF